MNGVKESARLFQQMHPDTILYEAKGYNHSYLSAYLPQEWIKLVVPFLENNNWLYKITPHKLQLVGHFLLLVFLLQNKVCFFNFVKGNSHDYGQDKKN